MPSTDDPGAIDGLTYTGAEWRRMDAMTFQANGSAAGMTGGIRPGDPGLAVTLAGSVVNVSAGVAVLYHSGTGAYRASFPTAISPGSLAAADLTNPRLDLVYLRVWDSAVDGTGLYKTDIVYLAGTAAVSPVAPTPGALEIYIPLATVSVPKSGGGSPSVSSTVRAITVAPGGISNSGTAAGTHAGQYRDGNGYLERYNGSAWQSRVPLSATGVVDFGGSGGSAPLSMLLPATNSDVLNVRGGSDTVGRLLVSADGTHAWGPGTGSRDTTLARTGVGALALTGSIAVSNGLAVAAGVGSQRTPYKAADATGRTTTTLAVDTDLLATVEANATYTVEGHFEFTGAAGGDIKFDWVIPSGAALTWALLGTGTANFTDYDASVITATTARGARGNGATVQSANPRGTLTVSSTSGTIQVRWAQNTTNATATVLKAGSWIRLVRIA